MAELAVLRQTTHASVCQDCGKCTSHCPLAPLTGLSPRRVVTAVRPADQRAHIERCLGCAACDDRCPQDVQISAYVRGLRELTPPAERSPCSHGGMLQAAARLQARGQTGQRKLDWLGDGLETTEQGEVGLFVGCLPLMARMFDQELGTDLLEIARSAVRVLNHLGIAPVVVEQEVCCGHDLLWKGEREEFSALARKNTEAFSARGVKQLLTTCAECARTWRLDYPGETPGYRPQVQHMAEFLTERLETGELHFEADGQLRVGLQDACRLSRHLGAQEAPRRLLEAIDGDGLVELAHSGKDARCCGTSGFTSCDAASRTLQEQRLGEATDVGAESLITACPKCLVHFSCTQAGARRRGQPLPALVVEDITVHAAARLDGEDRKQQTPELTGVEAGECS